MEVETGMVHWEVIQWSENPTWAHLIIWQCLIIKCAQVWFSLHWPRPKTSIWIVQCCNAGYMYPNRKIIAINISPGMWQFLPNMTTSYCFLWFLLPGIIPGQIYGDYLPHFDRDNNFNWLFIVQNWCGYVFHATLRNDPHFIEVILNIFLIEDICKW